MVNNELKCPICGEPTRVYMGNARKDGLCAKHAEMLKKGEIILNKEGLFEDAKTKKILNSNFSNPKIVSGKKCIVCGKESEYDLCSDCYKKKQRLSEEIKDSTTNYDDTKDYYNNLKYNIFRLKNKQYVSIGCLKLLALGDKLQNYYKAKGYSELAKAAVIDILKKKNEYQQSKMSSEETEEVRDVVTLDNNVIREEKSSNSEILDYRRVFPMNIRCDDGHYVRSKSEKMIDDFLFRNKILHVYEKRVINEDNDEQYYPDFYFKVEDNGREIEIYLEYFGKDDEEYLATEAKKLAYYQKAGYNVISVKPENDGNLSDYIEDQIRKIKKKYRS